MSEDSTVIQELAAMIQNPAVTDTDLGQRLLVLAVVHTAESRGLIPKGKVDADGSVSITRDQYEVYQSVVQSIIAALPNSEAYGAKEVAIEKAVRKAATGDYQTAGRLLREYMLSGARTLQLENAAVRESDRRKAGGKKRAELEKQRMAKRDAEIVAMYDELLQGEWNPRDVASYLAKKRGLHPSSIRKILRKAGRR
jgi:hypothetical protein